MNRSKNDSYMDARRATSKDSVAVPTWAQMPVIETPVYCLGKELDCELYVKREDLIPYSFGGNKARKGFLFYNQIDQGKYDCVVTYGSSHSNHCRIIANMAAARGIKCFIIGPSEASVPTFNSSMMDLFGAEITVVPVERVHDAIEQKLLLLKQQGCNPFFIPGGGHGNIGTEAYVRCYDEIRAYESENGIYFDYIFFASGTGTTQAGLVCGQLLHCDDRAIVGISIARKKPRGRDVVLDSIRDYLSYVYSRHEDRLDVLLREADRCTIFVDDYIGAGYGHENKDVIDTIRDVMLRYGIPLDSTYTGKAFYGMRRYLSENGVNGKKVLFIHTGGTPLFFNDISREDFRDNLL